MLELTYECPSLACVITNRHGFLQTARVLYFDLFMVVMGGYYLSAFAALSSSSRSSIAARFFRLPGGKIKPNQIDKAILYICYYYYYYGSLTYYPARADYKKNGMVFAFLPLPLCC